MRYKLNTDGYVKSVSFGCYLDGCTEYTGEVPLGYDSLPEWADNACIQAYYIDAKGNLMLDLERLAECRNKEAQEAIDYAPLIRRDLYETDEILDSQWIKDVAAGEVIVLEDIKTIAPRVKVTGLNPLESTKFSLFTHGRNMMPCDIVTGEVEGVTFTKNDSGSITVKGIAAQNIEYRVAGGTDAVIFALKGGNDYYLNLGGLECELRRSDGETAQQQYVGPSGLLNLEQSIEVTEVILKITSGESVNVTFYPQLEYGNAFTEYEAYKRKALEIDFTEAWPETLYPSDKLYASDTLYVGQTTAVLDYILINNGRVSASINGREQSIGTGNVGLFSEYNTIYATQDAGLEIVYSTNVYDVNSLEFLQGKATTTNQFKILKDGSIEAHNGYFSGKIEADSGKIGGFDISTNAITNQKTSIRDNKNGIYIGPDGISVGFGAGDKHVGFLIDSTGYLEISGAYMEALNVGTSALIGGVTISGNDISLGYYGSLNCHNITGCESISGSGGSISIGVGGVSISGQSIGFFGASSWQQRVNQLSTYWELSTDDVANKLNELIGALSAYGLV